MRHSQRSFLQFRYQLERTQISTISILAMQNTWLTGYVLTGNESMFLDTTNGCSVAWFYHFPKNLSPPGVADERDDQIPNL